MFASLYIGSVLFSVGWLNRSSSQMWCIFCAETLFFLLLLLPLSFPIALSGRSSLLCKDAKLNRAIPSLSPTSIYFANGNDKSLRGSILCAIGLCICKFSQCIIIFSHGHKAMLLKTSPGDDKPQCWMRWAEASIFIYSLWFLFYLYIFEQLEFRQFNRLEK